jgi:hypothetical protein
LTRWRDADSMIGVRWQMRSVARAITRRLKIKATRTMSRATGCKEIMAHHRESASMKSTRILLSSKLLIFLILK